jgi:hypothetical protein
MILGATDQKLWVFEVLRRSLGRAGMCWSQPAIVDHMHKKWRAGGKLIILNYYFWKFGEWARAFERMGVRHPIF